MSTIADHQMDGTEVPLPALVRPGHGIRGRAIILASDGSLPSRAAMRVAWALAAAHGARPHVIRALDVASWPSPGPVPYLVNVASTMLGGDVEAQHAETLRAGLESELVDSRSWPIDVEIGAAADLITRAAERLHAALVVMGLRRHGTLDRLAHDETTSHVMAESRCPVLGVVPELHSLPQRVVIGVDFSAASARAARAALDVVAFGGRLMLTYVRSPWIAVQDEAEGEGLIHALGLRAAFATLMAPLANDVGVTIEQVVVDASPGAGIAGALRHVAERADAELIAVGSHHHPFIDRWLLGSVTRDLARDAGRSLLVVPPVHRLREPHDGHAGPAT